MYSENNRRTATGRANDEFLRRMIGGELAHGVPLMNTNVPPRATLPDYSENKTACDGQPRGENSAPMCNNNCPVQLHAPSLAMVYSPHQSFEELFSTEEALSHGTLFRKLNKPWMPGGGCR